MVLVIILVLDYELCLGSVDVSCWSSDVHPSAFVLMFAVYIVTEWDVGIDNRIVRILLYIGKIIYSYNYKEP